MFNIMSHITHTVWDTAGQERYQAMSKSYYRNADGMVLVYSQDDRPSFVFLQTILAEFEREDGGIGLDMKVVPSTAVANVASSTGAAAGVRRKKLYLVANKYDLGDDQRQVSIGEAQQLAKKYGMRFIECSAKALHNVDTPFLTCADDILNDVIIEPESANPNVDINNTKAPAKCAC
jgi:Ras-related protein Rab-18